MKLNQGKWTNSA